MDLSKPCAYYGVTAKAAATRHGITWTPRLGIPAAKQEFPDSNVIFTFLLTGITSVVVPSLDLATGAVTANGATVDGGTTDFEKSALGTIASIQAVIYERLDVYPGPAVVESDADTPGSWHVGPMETLPHLAREGALFTDPVADATALTFRGTVSNPTPAIALRVTVLGTLAP